MSILNRRNFIELSGKSLVATGVLPVLSASVFGQEFVPKDKYVKHITILHTNDQHSRIDPFPTNDRKYPDQGGISRRLSLINAVRKENPNTLLLDAGDILQGTPYFNFYEGELEFKLMDELGYTASTIGNHDFDAGIDRLDELIAASNFEMLNCNYDFSDTILAGKIKPYKIVEIDDIKIGILGVGVELDGLVPPSLYKNTIYLNPFDKTNEWAQHLKKEQKCDLVVLLSHLGYEYKKNIASDVNLATNSNNIDLILGGHTHSFLEKPRIVQNSRGSKVIINQVGWAGLLLGRLDLYFTESKNEKRILSKTIEIF